jgi:hypothetical protein
LGVGLDTEEQARGLSDLIFLPLAVLAAILERKGKVATFAYGWEPEPGAESQLTEIVSDRIFSFLIKSPGDPAPADISCSMFFVPIPHGGPGMMIGFGGASDITEAIDDDWTVKFRLRSADAVDFFFRFDELEGDVGVASDADATFSIETGADEAGIPYVLVLGERTRLKFGRLAVSGEITATGASVKFTAAKNALVISAKKDADPFVSESMPADETRIAFDFGIGLSSSRGLYLEGGSGLQSIIPIGKTLGPITVQHLQLGLVPNTEAGAQNVVLNATAALAFDLGLCAPAWMRSASA